MYYDVDYNDFMICKYERPDLQIIAYKCLICGIEVWSAVFDNKLIKVEYIRSREEFKLSDLLSEVQLKIDQYRKDKKSF